MARQLNRQPSVYNRKPINRIQAREEEIPSDVTTILSKIILRNDTSTNWAASDPVLFKGEVGIETDTNKIKIGDGAKTWSALPYANAYSLADLNLDQVDNTSDMDKPVSTAQQEAINNAVQSLYDALGTAALKDIGVNPGEVVVVQTSGKIDSKLIPSIDISNVYIVDTPEEISALSGRIERGDIAIVNQTNETFIFVGDNATDVSDWVPLLTPTSTVTSVNGERGVVVLDTDKINEGSTNLYYTEERVENYLNNFFSKVTIDGGNSASV